jgi:hypothetical protein
VSSTSNVRMVLMATSFAVRQRCVVLQEARAGALTPRDPGDVVHAAGRDSRRFLGTLLLRWNPAAPAVG